MHEDQTRIRLVTPDDAPALAQHLARDAHAFARWEPARPDDYYTTEGQARRIEQLLDDHRRGQGWSGVVHADGVPIGQVSVGAIIRGPFLKGSIGYWIASTHQNQGHARRALRLVLDVMAGEVGLHRAEASTQLDNEASQRVLRANGFSPCGIAHSHIFIAGAWRDSILWERTLET